MRIIELTKITADRTGRGAGFHTDTDEIGENGAPEGEAQPPALDTTPVSVNVFAIRCFYPRKDGRPGTRLTFTDGGGFAVVEAYDDVKALVSPTLN